MEPEATDGPPERLLYLELEETLAPEPMPSESLVVPESVALTPAETPPAAPGLTATGFEHLMPPGVSPWLVMLGVCGVLLMPASISLLRSVLFEALLLTRTLMFPLILLGMVIVGLGVLRTRLRR